MRLDDPALTAKRLAESAACRSLPEIFAAEQRWKREDEAAIRATPKRQPASMDQRTAKLGDIGTIIGVFWANHVRPALEQRDQRIAALEEQVRELEQRPDMFDGGVWDETKSYPQGAWVRHAGGGWIAQRQVSVGERPGTSHGWRLACKSDVSELKRLIREELAKR